MSKRCICKTKTNRRCKLKTKKSQKCWIHLKSTEHLRIKPSNIDNAGDGLHTTEKVKKNKKITAYGGKITTRKPKGHYTIKLKNNPATYMDGENPNSSAGRYANTCRKKDKKNKKCKGNNAKISVSKRHNKWNVNLKSTKNINKNDEVFLAYGNAFKIK